MQRSVLIHSQLGYMCVLRMYNGAAMAQQYVTTLKRPHLVLYLNELLTNFDAYICVYCYLRYTTVIKTRVLGMICV